MAVTYPGVGDAVWSDYIMRLVGMIVICMMIVRRVGRERGKANVETR